MSRHHSFRVKGQSEISRRMNAGESIPAWRPPHLRDGDVFTLPLDESIKPAFDQLDEEARQLRAAETRLRLSLQPWQVEILDVLLHEAREEP